MVRGNKATFPKCIVYNKPFYKGYRRNPGHGWIEFIDNILFFYQGYRRKSWTLLHKKLQITILQFSPAKGEFD